VSNASTTARAKRTASQRVERANDIAAGLARACGWVDAQCGAAIRKGLEAAAQHEAARGRLAASIQRALASRRAARISSDSIAPRCRNTSRPSRSSTTSVGTWVTLPNGPAPCCVAKSAMTTG
jgi:hypothetical protein